MPGKRRRREPRRRARSGRAIWKASLALRDVALPVKLYAAVEDRDVHFRLLHARDSVPVEQKMVDPRSGTEVEGKDVRHGLEVAKGVFVILSEEEIESVEPPESRDIEVTRFVPASAVDPAWYRRPYMLGPDGDDDEDYFALARALRESERVGIARWVMRKQRYTGVLSPVGEYLSLVTLHDASDVVTAAELEPAGGPAVGKGERRLAEQLVSALDAPFEPESLHDEYRERLRALIDARAKGRKFEMPKERVSRMRPDLEDALRESLQAAKERHVAA
jgi:DNA end-binding protein Ku